MKTFAIFATLFAAASVTAAPTANMEAQALDKRAGGPAVAVWADKDFKGRQQTFHFGNRGDCLTLGNGWNDVISSFVVLPGWTCKFYFDAGCRGIESLPAGYRDRDYAVPFVGSGSNDKWSSIRCY